MSVMGDLPGPILTVIRQCGLLAGVLGESLLMAFNGSDDRVIEGISGGPDTCEVPVEEAIQTNRDDIETVQRNQRRMYALQQETHKDLKGLFFKGIGLLVTLMVALLGMMGTFLALLL